jgi:hypothetical protein
MSESPISKGTSVSRPLFLETLKKKVLIFDGAMGTNVQTYNLTKEDFGGKEGLNDYLVITHPDVIREIHLEVHQEFGLFDRAHGGIRPPVRLNDPVHVY